DLPAHHQVLEQHLVPPGPDVLGRSRVLLVRLVELPDRPVVEGLPQGEHVALRVGVVHRLDWLAALLSARHGTKHLSPAPPTGRGTECFAEAAAGAAAGAAAADWDITMLTMMIQIPISPKARNPMGVKLRIPSTSPAQPSHFGNAPVCRAATPAPSA